MQWFSIIVSCALLISGTAFSKGDPQAGKAKSATCIACHGPNGNSVNPVWPKLAGLDAGYSAKHLQYFKEGKRVNALMAPQVAALSKQDMEDLSAYYESLERSAGAADEKLVKLGQAIYRGGNEESGVAACIACHGPKGNGNPAAGYPRISYQHAAYMVVRLKTYRDGTYTYPSSEIMNGIAKNLTDKEIEAVSSYVQGLH